jgi:hypothetical protein
VVSSAALGNANTLYSLLQLGNPAPVSSVSGSGRAPDRDGGVHGVGTIPRDSAQISGPGRLLSQLQQLQVQDPAKFKTVVANIASQLQVAAKQQGQTPEGQFLSQLANKYQAVATGGDLSQLQPHRAGHTDQQTYTPFGQAAPQIALAPVHNSRALAFPSSDLQQLFTSISKEVSQALGS